MIIYDLRCDNEHRFEGWFRSAVDFDDQMERHLVSCPQCDSHAVKRVPSAVAIGTQRGEPVAEAAAVAKRPAGNSALMPAGTQVMALYKQLVDAMLSNSEDVGSAFADEARKIHYNEAPERPIRGEASEEECEALRDEGIPILRIPGIKEEDLN